MRINQAPKMYRDASSRLFPAGTGAFRPRRRVARRAKRFRLRDVKVSTRALELALPVLMAEQRVHPSIYLEEMLQEMIETARRRGCRRLLLQLEQEANAETTLAGRSGAATGEGC